MHEHPNLHQSSLYIPVSQSLHFWGVLVIETSLPGRRRRSMSLPEKPTKSIEENPMNRKARGTAQAVAQNGRSQRGGEAFLSLDLCDCQNQT